MADSSEPNISVLQQHLQDVSESLDSIKSNADHFFLLIMACLIFFMQCGFAFLEAGSVRSKNTTNILIKNLLDVCLGAFAYWGIGYAFAFGSGNEFIGHRHFFFESLDTTMLSHWFFHFVFAATAATIVSGAMAERTEFGAYMIYSFIITGFIYPVVSHWAWSEEGWLYVGPGNGITYQDFAGSGVVHMVGGTAALVGAAVLGPRMGRFVDGKPVDISGHTVPLVALGGFILMFGFFAFNGGSQASISQPGDGPVVALAIVNTTLAGSFGALVALAIRRTGLVMSGSWSLLTTINGALTGMVAICAGCCCVHPWGACAIGVIAGFTYIFWSWVILKVGIDDPLDAVAVHLGGGLWGVISVPILAIDSGIVFRISDAEAWQAFGWNLAGAGAIAAWSGILSLILFGLMHCLKILRVSRELEIKGLDIPKHGEPAYPVESYGHGWGAMGIALEKHTKMNGIDNRVRLYSSLKIRDQPSYLLGGIVQILQCVNC
ncbi:putative ammonium transporter 1 isoform X1 [Ptychodera flava]|uniref:putative ammonium transporter 1 isoform X1 n=1 Tax=Ptychodera flava TaxID=63121 RepID=UPI003969CEF4